MHLYLCPYYCSHIRVQVLEVTTGKFSSNSSSYLLQQWSGISSRAYTRTDPTKCLLYPAIKKVIWVYIISVGPNCALSAC